LGLRIFRVDDAALVREENEASMHAIDRLADRGRSRTGTGACNTGTTDRARKRGTGARTSGTGDAIRARNPRPTMDGSD
jgi:hypothetical protein